MFKRILKWTGLLLLMLVILVTIVTASRQNMQYEAPYPNVKASRDSIVIARGKQLMLGPAHCVDCHSTSNADSLINLGLEVPLTGAVPFVLPVGTIYSKNITSDSATGIGKLSDREIARSLRYGVHPNGTVVFDFMPFHNTSDEDLTAIISYLRTLQPVQHAVPEHHLNVAGNLVKAFMVKPVGPSGEVPAFVKPDTTAAYGKYLAMSIANCSGCHTKRDISGAYMGEYFAGGTEPMKIHPGKAGYIPPNITPDSTSQIFGWTQQNFIDRFRRGRVYVNSPMPWPSFSRMTDNELKAIYKFLQTVKPVKNKVIQPAG